LKNKYCFAQKGHSLDFTVHSTNDASFPDCGEGTCAVIS
jgi:hypothetical protein